MCDVRSLPAALRHPLLDQVPVDHMKGWGGLGAINDTPVCGALLCQYIYYLCPLRLIHGSSI